MEVITTLAAQGTMTASRTQRRPGKALFRNWARASEISTVSTTTPTTQTAELSSTRGNAVSAATRSKLSRPALPRSTPNAEMSRVALKIM